MPQTGNRPLSPHLQIYRLPLSAIVSISHRLTGVFLCLGLLVFLAVLITAAEGPQAYEPMRLWLQAWVGQGLLILFTYALYFHFCNGVRHLFWDAGYGFELKTVHISSYAVIVVSILMTAATWLAACGGNLL